MTRFYLYLTLIPITLFSVLMFLVRSQPYDDHELRELLLPENCPAPCFMGIRPGITTVDEALRFLKSSGWTADIQTQPISRWIIVHWNQQAPAWLLTDKFGSNLALATHDSKIEEIHVSTGLYLSEVELLMGRPASYELTIFRGMGETQFIPILDYTTVYPSRSTLVAISEPCNGEARISHASPNVVLRYYADLSPLADLLKQFHESWREVRDITC